MKPAAWQTRLYAFSKYKPCSNRPEEMKVSKLIRERDRHCMEEKKTTENVFFFR